MRVFSAGALALGLTLSTAAGAVTVNGVIASGEYAGAITTFVPYQASAVNTSFSTNQGSNTSAYTVFYTSDASNVYIGLQQNPAGAGNDNFDGSVGVTLANLYFNGIGFEVFNDRAFRPGGNGSYYNGLLAAGANYARTQAVGYAGGPVPGVIEVSIPWTVFTQNTLGVGEGYAGVAPGGNLQLRISQSFGFSPSLGDFQDTSGVARFGTLQAPSAVPEPATWAMMLIGFGAVGVAARRRRAIAIA